MCQVTVNKLEATQSEVGQQRALLDEMAMRRESSDTMLRRQRTALKDYKEKNERLRDELKTEAARHAVDSQQIRQQTQELKTKLHQAYAAMDESAKKEQVKQEKEEADSSAIRREAAAGDTIAQQSERIYDLTELITENGQVISTLREEIASLHKQNSTLMEDRSSRLSDSAIAMDAMSFFDMDCLGLHTTESNTARENKQQQQRPPPPPSTSSSHLSPGRRHPKRTSAGMDNCASLISLRDASRHERSTALQSLLASTSIT